MPQALKGSSKWAEGHIPGSRGAHGFFPKGKSSESEVKQNECQHHRWWWWWGVCQSNFVECNGNLSLSHSGGFKGGLVSSANMGRNTFRGAGVLQGLSRPEPRPSDYCCHWVEFR